MKQQIIEELMALEAHYPHPNRTPHEQARWMRDYADDLGSVDLETVKRACRQWRHSEAERFPTPGQMIRLVQSLKPREGVQAAHAWRPISEDEYESLSLEEKARHHMIMGNRAEMRAGPMMRGRVHLMADQMPPEWHELKERAKNHFQEAKTLRGFKHDRPKVSASPGFNRMSD